MDNAHAIENLNNRNSEIEDKFDNCTDHKVCVYETVISGGYIKQEPSDSEHEPGNIHNYIDIKDEIIQDPTIVVQETGLTTNIKGNYLTCCEGCGEEYDLYCFKCPMLIRIFDSNNTDLGDNGVIRTLPKNFVDMCETQSGMGIIALKDIPKGVVFGPFVRLDSTKDDAVSKWIWKEKELGYTKDLKWLNWMQYIRKVDQSSHPNLTPFRYEDGLYYRSDCYISAGDELLVGWDSDCKESLTQKPQICESLDDTYACTLCCVGYKSICQLSVHNSRCSEKRNRDNFCKEIIQCSFCKIYLDKKEYSDYHMDQCSKSNRKIFAMHEEKKCSVPIYKCNKCVFDTTNALDLALHLATHEDAKPHSCSTCEKQFQSKASLLMHIKIVHNEKKNKYKCRKCDFEAIYPESMKEHLLSVHGDVKVFKCPRCIFKTCRRKTFDHHLQYHNDAKPIKCESCDIEFSKRHLLVRHQEEVHALVNKAYRFVCSHCPFKSTTKGSLKRHITTHSDDKPFACPHCSYKARTNSNLKEHVAIHNDDKPFACTFCSYKTRTNSQLRKHTAIHTDDKRFACPHCSRKMRTNMQLKRHIVTHNDDKPFACPLCSYKTKTKLQLKQHIATHSDDAPFACPHCSYKATTNPQLQRHIDTHTDNKPFACSLCPYKARTLWNLKQHVVIHKDDKPFACSLCSYKTRANLDLKRHMVTHNDDSPFECAQCPFKTKTNRQLKRHVATHSDDKPFACSLCSYKARTNSILQEHVVVHNDDKPFACTFCSYKGRTNSQLKKHTATHSDDKRFPCSLCSQKMTTNFQLKRHMVIHNDDKPFACTFCPYKTKRNGHLKRHIAIHNRDNSSSFMGTGRSYKTTTDSEPFVTTIKSEQHVQYVSATV